MAQSQLSLFDSAARCRASDPVTSKQAATQLECVLNATQEIAYEACARVQSIYGNATANEIGVEGSRISPKPPETIRKRCHELLRVGRIREVTQRKCSVTGKVARAFRTAVASGVES